MSALKEIVQRKLYQEYGGEDLFVTNQSILVYLGNEVKTNFRKSINDGIKNTLKQNISESKIVEIYVNTQEELIPTIEAKLKTMKMDMDSHNRIAISFITVMDDGIYEESKVAIDINGIQRVKEKILGGYSVSFIYDFYGIFVSPANNKRRGNARKTIVEFLNCKEITTSSEKRVFHQSCPGEEYERTGKAISFVVLANMIDKLAAHTTIYSEVEGEEYSWNTLAFYEQNMQAIVIYKLIYDLLERQNESYEKMTQLEIAGEIEKEINEIITSLAKKVPKDIKDYMPCEVIKKTKKQSKARLLIFKRDEEISYYEKKDEGEFIRMILERQKKEIEEYLQAHLTKEMMTDAIEKLISQCTSLSSIDPQRGIIGKGLRAAKEEYKDQMASGKREVGDMYFDYDKTYEQLLKEAKYEIISRIENDYSNRANEFQINVRKNWNEKRIDIEPLLRGITIEGNYQNVVNRLIENKYIFLLSEYREMLKIIEVNSIIGRGNNQENIFPEILANFFRRVQNAGDIVCSFGGCPLSPNPTDISYHLYSYESVSCPDKLEMTVDSKWFREHAISILLTVKNQKTECRKLPWGEEE